MALVSCFPEISYSTVQQYQYRRIYHLMINIHMWGPNHLVSCCTVKLFNSFLNHLLTMHCIRKVFFLTSLWIKHHQIENCCKSIKKHTKTTEILKTATKKTNPQLHFPYVLWFVLFVFYFHCFIQFPFCFYFILFIFFNISRVFYSTCCAIAAFFYLLVFS